MSCRQAAERFGVSASSAIRWQQRVRTTGTIEPRTQGGDRRSKRIEAHSQVILGLVAETPDITLVGITARLKNRGSRHRLARDDGGGWRACITHGTQLPAQGLLGDREAELLEHPLAKIDNPPAHDAMDSGD
jgi:hypothetical protein